MKFNNKTNLRKHLARILNVGILAAICALVFVAGKKAVTTKPTVAADVAVGQRFSIPMFEPKQGTKTLYLFLSSGCQYCASSIGFYQRLIKQSTEATNLRLVAVFPADDAQGKDFLKVETPLETAKLNFAEYGVSGTPTLVLVDEGQNVLTVWRGKLTLRKESSVMQELGLENENNQPKLFVKQSELTELRKKKPVNMVDLSEREKFAQNHLSGAINIPFDELYVRGINELPTASTIILYDTSNNTNRCEAAQTALFEQGFTEVLVLDQEAK